MVFLDSPLPADPTPLTLRPLGVDPKQEGCSYWVELGSYALLLDCGGQDPSRLEQLPRQPDGVICSHAHPDHLRLLPKLHQRYPNLPIYGTRLTYRLAAGLWNAGIWSVGKLAEEFPPLHCLPYNRATDILPDLTLSFFQAGHLPGAAVSVLHYTGVTPAQTIVYTGDCSLAAGRFTEGLDLMALRYWCPDVMVIEGSLGMGRFPPRRQAESRLIERLAMGIEQGFLLLIPVPAVGLGQELLYLLKTHHRFTRSGSGNRIWIDSAIQQGCDLYQELLAEMPQSVQNFAQHQSLFWESRLDPWVQPLPGSPSEQITALSASGILLYHAEASLQEWQLLWQSLQNRHGDPPLRMIQLPEVKLAVPLDQWPTALRSGMELDAYPWHSHIDSNALVQILHTCRPHHVVLTHSSQERLTDLANLPDLCNRYHIHCPALLHCLELPTNTLPFTAESDVNRVERRYEGSVDEVVRSGGSAPIREGAVQIVLPAELTTDPRWQHWADTGVIEARWQGNELVLRGLTAREVIKPVEPDLDSSDDAIFG